MAFDSTLVLLNRTDLDSGNDGDGSGTDPTAGSGAVIEVPDGGEIGVVLFLGEADATAATSSETLAVILQVSRDGTNYGPLVTFRTITASEFGTIDESTGSVTYKLAAIVRLPMAEAARNHMLKLRLNVTASNTNHWAPYVAICDKGQIRDEWLATALGENI